MTITNNRTVHGRMADGTPIVRYDRSGKWYFEPADGKRRNVTTAEAARAAALGTAHFGLPGGSAFDRVVRRLPSVLASEPHVSEPRGSETK